jgi:hypothetical protein
MRRQRLTLDRWVILKKIVFELHIRLFGHSGMRGTFENAYNVSEAKFRLFTLGHKETDQILNISNLKLKVRNLKSQLSLVALRVEAYCLIRNEMK